MGEEWVQLYTNTAEFKLWIGASSIFATAPDFQDLVGFTDFMTEDKNYLVTIKSLQN
jgi:hypothetical protein